MMVDVEMDLDPSRTMGHDEHIDEDIIEYDLDTDAMDGTNNDWAAEDLEIQDVDESHADNDMDTHHHTETLADDTTEHNADAMDTLDVLPFSGTSVNDADMMSDLGNDEDLAHGDVEELDDADAVEDGAADTRVSGLGMATQEAFEGGPTGEPPAEPIEEVEEIDFGTVAEEIGDTDPPDAVDAAPQSGGTVENEAVEATIETAEGDINPPAEEEELTWEEDDDQQKGPPTPQATAAQQIAEADENVQEKAGSPSNLSHEEQEEHEVPEEPQETENSDTRDDGVVEEGVQEEKKVTADEQYEREEVQEIAPEATKPDVSYPSITVQYKGEEFPCFAASDGFFTNTSVLEESMERLLAGFRAELAAELAPDEELVFHVDELGLEFAEQDILAGTTLQYVLEIYEMLVQNQDQDHAASSKTLYTYLFTRSSTSKRLEFLVESATNGKGLDEVIHLFEPAMVHHKVEDTSDESPVILNEQGDDYPSPGDEITEDNGTEYEEDDSTHEPNQDAHTEVVAANSSAEELGGADPARFAEESTLVQDTSADEGRSTEVNDDQPSPQEIELEVNDDGTEQHETENQDELEGTYLDTVGAGNENIEAHESVVLPTEASATGTSTSSTVDGNEIPPTAAIEEGAEDEADETLVQPSHEGDDDLVEIDWREEGDEEAEDAPTEVQTTPAKRARADDGLSFDEENGAKRQRSS